MTLGKDGCNVRTPRQQPKPKRITPEQLAASGTEDGHQAAFYCWANEQVLTGWMPELALMFAIPNGGKRGKATAARLRATGTKRGVPDNLLPVRRGGYAGLFVELKRPKSEGKAVGRESDEQGYWKAQLQAQGYGVATCVGWEQMRDTVIAYLSQPKA